MRKLQFDSVAFHDYQDWIKNDSKIALRIGELIKDILRDPFKGIGKPDALKYDLKGYWSRRINEEHRLVYKITNDEIIITGCKFHYK